MDCFQKCAAQAGIAVSCCYLLPATTVTLCAPLNPKVCLEPDTYEAECVLRRVNWGKLSETRRHRPVRLHQYGCQTHCSLMQVSRHYAFSRGPMVKQLCTEVVGFVIHHLADAVPSQAITLWFLVISGSVQLACRVAVRMPVLISVVSGLPMEQESITTLVPSYAAICA